MIGENNIWKMTGLKFLLSFLVLFYVAVNNNTLNLLLDSSDRTEQMETSEESSENKDEKKETEDDKEDKLVHAIYAITAVNLTDIETFVELPWVLKPFTSPVLSPPPELFI